MSERKYKTDSTLSYCGDRCSATDYALQRKVLEPFSIVKRYPTEGSWCGNVRAIFYNGQAKLESGYNPNSLGISGQEQISSALALYRLLAVLRIPPHTKHVDFYKLNWEYILRHRKTKQLLVFGEWKGGFQIFTPFGNAEGIPESYRSDVENLLTALVRREWPIGYDGTVAGEVA